MKKQIYLILVTSVIVFTACQNTRNKTKKAEPVSKVWTAEQSKAWHEEHGWLRGCNFNPSTAINQLEMWQAESFDLETIDRELGWAE
ncbi:unnamed protein product, partial [marine sediment metagenome]